MRRQPSARRTASLAGMSAAWLAAAAVALGPTSRPATAPPAVPGWRGQGDGDFSSASPPLRWGVDEHVLWKLAMPGPSNSSPVVAGDQVLTLADPHWLVSVDLKTGQEQWRQANDPLDALPADQAQRVRAQLAEASELEAQHRQLHHELMTKLEGYNDIQDPAKKAELDATYAEYQAKMAPLEERLKPTDEHRPPLAHPLNGMTTATPVTDGQHVWSVFGAGVVTCHDLTGQRKWIRALQRPTIAHGHSSSPVLAGGRLVVQVDDVFCLDPATGETLWTQKSAPRWGTPTPVTLANGVAAVATCNGSLVRVDDGRVLARGMGVLPVTTPLLHNSRLYYADRRVAAYDLPTDLSLGATQPADAPAAKAVWTTSIWPQGYYASPVIHDGLLYAVAETGHLSVVDVATGKKLATKKLDLGLTGDVKAYPSLAVAGDQVFVSGASGVTAVVEPGAEVKVKGRSLLEPFRSTPVFVGQRMLVRGLMHLWCVGR